MVYQNIEFHNAAELIECEDGGVRWLRVPQRVFDAMETEQGRNMCRNSTGVELRFVMKSDTVKLKIKPLTDKGIVGITLFFGGLQGGWDTYGEGGLFCGESEIVIKRPQNMEMMKRMSDDSGYGWDAEVVRVVINRGAFKLMGVEGEVCPPDEKQTPCKTMLVYGSSITHGSNSVAVSNTWASVLAHNLNADLINLGMAGSCRMEPEMIEYIASLGEKGVWDTAVLELGINVLDWDEDKIRQRVSNALHQTAAVNTDKKIYIVSPFYCHNDYRGGTNADKWRKCIEEITKQTAYPNVEYINGLDILGDVSGLSADEVHPNIYGIQQIANRFTERIGKI